MRVVTGLFVVREETHTGLVHVLRENTTLETLWNATLTLRDAAQVDAIVRAVRESNTALLYFGATYVINPAESTEIAIKFGQLNAETVRNCSLDLRAREILLKLREERDDDTKMINPDEQLYVLATVPEQRLLEYVNDDRMAKELGHQIGDAFFRLTRVCRAELNTVMEGKLPRECWHAIFKYLRVTDVVVR